jgi:hypothetical protein
MNEIARIALLASLLAMFTLPTFTIHAVAGTPPYNGAPGPLLGAGLPFLGIVGGVYWIARRLRRKSD